MIFNLKHEIKQTYKNQIGRVRYIFISMFMLDRRQSPEINTVVN